MIELAGDAAIAESSSAKWVGVPADVRALITAIRDEPLIQAFLHTAADALERTALVPPAEFDQWMQPVDENIERALDAIEERVRNPLVRDRANLRMLLHQRVWEVVFTGVPFPINRQAKLELWPGMRSVIGVENGTIVAPRVDPAEWPQVKNVMDKMTSDLRHQHKRGPKARYKSATRLRLDIRDAKTSLRKAKRPITIRAVAGLLGLSEDALVANCRRLGVDPETEFGDDAR